MASGLIVILAALIPFLLNLISAKMSPAAVQKDTNEDIERAVVTGDVGYINAYLHDRVQDSSAGSRDTIRQGNKI